MLLQAHLHFQLHVHLNLNLQYQTMSKIRLIVVLDPLEAMEVAAHLHSSVYAVGEWTNRLYNYFEQEQSKPSEVYLSGTKPDTFFKMPAMIRKV